MSFLWPDALLLLGALPLLIAAYLFILERRKKFVLRFASLDIVKEAMGERIAFRRHVPPLLFLLSIGLLVVAMARPQATVTLPSQHETVILAMDVSGSMRASDVEPNRLVAAQNAAKQFIAEQPDHVRIGIVAFAGTATVAQAPTNNKDDLIAAIDRFQLQRATAIGSAILVSLATLFPKDGIDVATFSYPGSGRKGAGPDGPGRRDPGKAVAPGSFGSAVIILLTDGQRTTGPDSIEAARFAADKGVRVYTVGIGTTEGKIVGFEGWSMHVRLDEETLKTIADLTRGEYFYAGSAPDLNKVYKTLNSKVVLETRKTEITAIFAAAAALVALLAALLSLLWFSRLL